jgi:DHA3 family macrolide efflux protein-like MFS transporter
LSQFSYFLSARALTAILVQRFFAGEALQYATLESMLGIGMVVGGLALGVWGGLKSRIKTAMLALVLVGLRARLAQKWFP